MYTSDQSIIYSNSRTLGYGQAEQCTQVSVLILITCLTTKMWNGCLGWLRTSWDPGSGCQFGLNHHRPWVKAGSCGFTALINTICIVLGSRLQKSFEQLNVFKCCLPQP